MVNISTRSWGLILTMTPPLVRADLARLFDELRTSHLQESKGFFGVFFDLSQIGPLHPDLRDSFITVLKLLLQRGMVRSAFCADPPLLVSQLRRLALTTETSPGARFLDLSFAGWRNEAEAWSARGTEPEHNLDASSSQAGS